MGEFGGEAKRGRLNKLATRAGFWMAKEAGIEFRAEEDSAAQLRLLCETICDPIADYTSQNLEIVKVDENKWRIYRSFADFDGEVPSVFAVQVGRIGSREKIRVGKKPLAGEKMAMGSTDLRHLESEELNLSAFDLDREEALNGDSRQLENYKYLESLIQELQWILINKTALVRGQKEMSMFMHSVGSDPQLVRMFSQACVQYPEAMNRARVRLGMPEGQDEIFQALLKEKIADKRQILVVRAKMALADNEFIKPEYETQIPITDKYILISRGPAKNLRSLILQYKVPKIK